jgi:hypothetical protein
MSGLATVGLPFECGASGIAGYEVLWDVVVYDQFKLVELPQFWTLSIVLSHI